MTKTKSGPFPRRTTKSNENVDEAKVSEQCWQGINKKWNDGYRPCIQRENLMLVNDRGCTQRENLTLVNARGWHTNAHEHKESSRETNDREISLSALHNEMTKGENHRVRTWLLYHFEIR
jgi:hypothetical protein